MPFISIVIPVYNSEKTIIGSLKSVFNQTYSDYEVIVVNDGSTDTSIDLISQNFKNEISVGRLTIINQVNQGVSTARNCGMKNSKGEFIAFLDSDDQWMSNKLERVLPHLSKGYAFYAHNWCLSQALHSTEQKKNKELTFYEVLLRNPVVTPSVVFKNTQSYFFDDSIRFAEDHELWLRMLNKNKAYFIDETLTILGRRPLTKGGLSGNKLKMRLGEMNMYFIAAKYRRVLIPSLPFLLVYSFLKHCIKIFR